MIQEWNTINMKNELITENINAIIEWVKSAEIIVESQAPQIVQEIITLGKARFFLYLFSLLIVFVVSCIMFRTMIKNYSGEPAMILPIFGAVMSFLFTISTIYTLLQLYIAPRLYIISELKNVLER